MDTNCHVLSHRDRQILCGLFLSKFDQDGLAYLGFDCFTEAFNVIGYSLQARPASIKNYRDELDPYFPNNRRGWNKRPLRDHCRKMLDLFRDADIEHLGDLVQTLLMPGREVESIPEVKRVLSVHNPDVSSSFAKRLITGRAAERYFASNYSVMTEFTGLASTDVTQCGCGFDFKLAAPNGDPVVAVEVKGLHARCGQIQLTELEHEMADALRDRYYLVLVRNFVDQPFHTVINNPVECSIRFTKVERKEVRLSWTANVVD